MKPSKRLTDPSFVWIPPDKDSTKFRERQLQRIREAQKSNVKPLRKQA